MHVSYHVSFFSFCRLYMRKWMGINVTFFWFSSSFACWPHLFLSFSFISAPFLFPQGAAAAAPKMVVPQRFREMLFAISKGALDLCVEAPGGRGFSIGVLWLWWSLGSECCWWKICRTLYIKAMNGRDRVFVNLHIVYPNLVGFDNAGFAALCK